MNPIDRMSQYLNANQIPFEIVSHTHTSTSRQAAIAAGVDSHCLVKTVLLEAPDCYLAAMIPADEQVRLGMLSRDYGKQLNLAPESIVREVFDGCDPGAAPGMPGAWDVDMVWEDDLLVLSDLYLEAGDHERLFHIETKHLRDLMQKTPHCHFSQPRTQH